MSDMKNNRGKGILLLGLLINLTACQTWQSASLGALIPAQVVEQVESHPSTTIRILVPGEPLLEVAYPMIEGDQLLGFVEEQRFSTPLSDIAMLEIQKLSLGKTLLFTLASLFVAIGVACGLETLKGNECSIE